MDPLRLARLRAEGGHFDVRTRADIVVTGTDRLRYLNGQLSNDLRRLTVSTAMPALVLTAKGRLCAEVFVWSEEDSLVVECDAQVADDLLARLERYAISDEVSFAPRIAVRRTHVFGPPASRCTGRSIRRLGGDGVDVEVAPDDILTATPDELECLRIERGVPLWGRELDNETFPQEAGLETHAVDFRKGCYVGQEVVSRLRSVGRVNRHLCGFVGTFAPQTPATLRVGETMVGCLTSACSPSPGTSIAIGYLSTRTTGERFTVHSESGACLGDAECSQFPLLA